MKILDIQTYIVDGQWWNWVFAKVTTDTGLHGWGEAPLAWKEHTAATAIKELGAVLIGEDPRHIEANLQLLHRGEYGGTGPVYNTAISALGTGVLGHKGQGCRAAGACPAWRSLPRPRARLRQWVVRRGKHAG